MNCVSVYFISDKVLIVKIIYGERMQLNSAVNVININIIMKMFSNYRCGT